VQLIDLQGNTKYLGEICIFIVVCIGLLWEQGAAGSNPATILLDMKEGSE